MRFLRKATTDGSALQYSRRLYEPSRIMTGSRRGRRCMKPLEGLFVLLLLLMSVLLGGLGSSADAAGLCANPGGQTGPKDCLLQCGTKRLCQLGITPFISIPGSHMLEAPLYLY